MGTQFVDLAAEDNRQVEAEHEARLSALDEETATAVRQAEARATERVEAARASLGRIDEVVGEVEAAAADERAMCDAQAEAEGSSRLELLDAVYQRRLERLCSWVGQTEEDERQLHEVVLREEAAAEAALAKGGASGGGEADGEAESGGSGGGGSGGGGSGGGWSGGSLVEARSRDLFDRGRAEHIAHVAELHDAMTPLFEDEQTAYVSELRALRSELASLSTSAVSEHVATVQAHMGEMVATAQALRAAAQQKQAEVATQLLTLHLEKIEQTSNASDARMALKFTEAMHTVRLRHAQTATAMEVALLRQRNTQHMGYARLFASAGAASWARERQQLVAHAHALTAERQRASDRAVTLAEAQVREHYAGLCALTDTWADVDAEEAAARASAEAEAARMRADEPRRTLAQQREAQRALLSTANELLAGDLQAVAAHRQAAAAAAAARLAAEDDACEEIVHRAQAEWRQQVAEGVRKDTAEHHERLLESEQRAHAEALQRATLCNARMATLRARCAGMLDTAAYRAALAEQQRQAARSNAAELAARTQAKLSAAHEALHAALARTRSKLEAVAEKGNEQVCRERTPRTVAPNSLERRALLAGRPSMRNPPRVPCMRSTHARSRRMRRRCC